MKRGPKPKQFCPKGHDKDVVGRSSSGICQQCYDEYHLEYDREYEKKRRKTKKCKEYRKKYALEHKERMAAIKRKHYDANKEKILQRNKLRYERLKKEILKKQSDYQRKHKGAHSLATLKCDERRKLRIPCFGQWGIALFYINCPKNKVVDHVIPLLGKLVSGLHVKWNLQYLTPKQNGKKGNIVDLILVSKKYGELLESLGLK